MVGILFLLALAAFWFVLRFEISFDWDKELVMFYTWKNGRHFIVLIKHNGDRS